MLPLQLARADSAVQEAQKARDDSARSISDSMLQQEAAMREARKARDAADQADHQLQKAQQAKAVAEQQR